jgi:hypothetical protein
MAELVVNKKSIFELLDFSKIQASKFIIPDYQRPYAWIKEKCETLWNDIFEGNILHFCRSWTGDEIYRVEILHEKCEHGEYKIRTFYVDRTKVDENFLEYLEFSMHSLIVLIYWCLLKRDIRHLIFNKYGQGEEGSILLWSEFGNMLFIDED